MDSKLKLYIYFSSHLVHFSSVVGIICTNKVKYHNVLMKFADKFIESITEKWKAINFNDKPSTHYIRMTSNTISIGVLT